MTSGPALDLALVIPVKDDAAGLARLLADPVTRRAAAEIIVVDDGSDPALVPPEGVRLIRHDAALGPGPARNRGLAEVTAAHLLFFDADDRLTPELLPLLADLAEAGRFDLCQFKYADGREARAGHWGQPGWDEHHWAQAGVLLGALSEVAPGRRPALAQTANYPWNKVFRTDFLRDSGIGCAATRLHEDIALHWGGHVAATRSLASDRICAWHEVRAGGMRQTNLAGPGRLDMIAAAEPAIAAVASHPDPAWRAALASFLLGLSLWAEERIGADIRPAWDRAVQGLFARLVADWGAEIGDIDPDLAKRLARRGALS